MNKFYSALVINSKRFPDVKGSLKPLYNKEYFKRLTANLSQLEALIELRCNQSDPNLTSEKLKDLKENSHKLANLDMEQDVALELQDRLMPTVLSIPNRLSKHTPEQDVIVDERKSDFQARENLVKVLSHRKLSYINNCYTKSVVGPNSHYYFGIGAKLHLALSSYFTNQLERCKFVPISGLCLTKSAVVEAANSKDGKEYFKDPARITQNSSRYTTLHLSESSRESLLGFLTTLGPIPSNNPLRLMTSGSSYRLGTDWFDGDDKHITQTETVHAIILNSSIEQYSLAEYQKVKDLIWSTYQKLELPVRLIHCSGSSMLMNEFDAYRVEIWLPSRHDWIQVGRVSHYRDYLTLRAGMKRGHIIDSIVYDGQALVAAIIENRQTGLGKFIIPNALSEYLPFLTSEERANYLRDNGPSSNSDLSSFHQAKVLTNHEQRRYLVKKSYVFGHGKKARVMNEKKTSGRTKLMGLTLFFMTLYILDFDVIWCDYLTDGPRAFLYDNIYVPYRRLWVLLFFSDHNRPTVLPYAEIDKSRYQLTRSQRRQDEFYTLTGRQRPNERVRTADKPEL